MFSLIDALARDEFTVAFLRACDEFTVWRLHPVSTSLWRVHFCDEFTEWWVHCVTSSPAT